MKKTSPRWPLRLLILGVVLGLVFISSSRDKARADITYSCEQQYGFCTYNCSVACYGDPQCYTQCRWQCEMNNNTCHVCDNYPFLGCMGGVDIPEPYPVFADFSMCMDDCNTSCNWLPLGERAGCFVPCKANCIALYGT